MAKNSIIMSVSVPKDQAEFLDEQNLSPSDLIQEKILEQKRIFDTYNQEKAKLVRNIEAMQKEMELIHTFLDEIQKDKDYYKWRGEYVLAKKE